MINKKIEKSEFEELQDLFEEFQDKYVKHLEGNSKSSLRSRTCLIDMIKIMKSLYKQIQTLRYIREDWRVRNQPNYETRRKRALDEAKMDEFLHERGRKIRDKRCENTIAKAEQEKRTNQENIVFEKKQENSKDVESFDVFF